MSVAWVFPGQGSQVVGMGRDVFEASPAARTVFERVDAALTPHLGIPLSRLCFEGPDEQLVLTANTQPAILATSMAILAALRERLPSLAAPAFVAGHSLGEYSALVAAEAMSVEDACLVVHERGKAMQQAVPPGEGAMSAVMGIDAPLLEELCRRAAEETGQVVSAANFNAPGQIVIAGATQAVERANALIDAAKGKAILLKVSAPFHCALMRPAAAVVQRALDAIRMSSAKIPVVTNVDALPRTAPDALKEALVRQVDAPVRWQASVEHMAKEGVTHLVEIGPGQVLTRLSKRISRGMKLHSVSDLTSLQSAAAFLSG